MSSDEDSRTEVACPIREQEQEQEQDEELKRPQKRRKTNLIYKKIKTYESLKLTQDDVKTISSSLVEVVEVVEVEEEKKIVGS